jgi:hypothetical protein
MKLQTAVAMLKTYEIMIENGQINWLTEQPDVKSARAIITFLEEEVLIDKIPESFVDKDSTWEELGGSEPQVQDIPRRRYDI